MVEPGADGDRPPSLASDPRPTRECSGFRQQSPVHRGRGDRAMGNRWPLVPWRVKNLVSEQFPLAYHLIANCGVGGNSKAHWDRRLEDTWDSPLRDWPGKVQA